MNNATKLAKMISLIAARVYTTPGLAPDFRRIILDALNEARGALSHTGKSSKGMEASISQLANICTVWGFSDWLSPASDRA